MAPADIAMGPFPVQIIEDFVDGVVGHVDEVLAFGEVLVDLQATVEPEGPASAFLDVQEAATDCECVLFDADC